MILSHRRIGDWRTRSPDQLRQQLALQESTLEGLVAYARQSDQRSDELQSAIEQLQAQTAEMRAELDAMRDYEPMQCSVGFSGNNTATTISSSGTFETVTQASWVADAGAVGFAVGLGDTSLVYTGETGKRVFWALTCNIVMLTGSLQEIWFRLAHAGATVGHYAARMLIAAQSEQQDQLHGLLQMNNGDSFTLQVRNESNSNNILVRRMSLQLIEVH